MILISACLLGTRVKYNGEANLTQWLARHFDPELFLPVCPEQLGGLPTPRPPAEILNLDGKDVVAGRGLVYNKEGTDVTRDYLAGAHKTLQLALEHQVTVAILKERSPSCGVSLIYDGRFNGTRHPGQGVTAALLAQHGIQVYSEQTLDETGLLKIIAQAKKAQD